MNKRRSSNLRQSLGMPLIVGTGFSLDQEAVGVKVGDTIVKNTGGAEQKKRLTYTRNGSSHAARPISGYQASSRQSQLGAGRQSQVTTLGRLSQTGTGRPSQTLYKGSSRPSTGRPSTGRCKNRMYLNECNTIYHIYCNSSITNN